MKGLFFGMFGIVVFSLSFATASFVCGEVEDGPLHSASWLPVTVYYEENKSDTVSCQVNPLGKFCCDIGEITSVASAPGKIVFAHVFDEKTGLVSSLEQVVLTANGYDVFPPLSIGPAVVVSPFKKVLVNDSQIDVQVNVSEYYPNVRYSIANEEGIKEVVVCTNCTSAQVPINLSKGENNLSFKAYNSEKEITINETAYNLDYFSFEREIECETCKGGNGSWHIRPGSNISITLHVSSSHNLSLELYEYIPVAWQAYGVQSQEHRKEYQKISFAVTGSEFSKTYTAFVPASNIPKLYVLGAQIGGIVFKDSVRVSRLRWLPAFFYREQTIETNGTKNSLKVVSISPKNPLVLSFEDGPVTVIGVYPADEIKEASAQLLVKQGRLWNRNKYRYSLETPLSSHEITSISTKASVQRGKTVSVFQADKEVAVSLEKEGEANDEYAFILPSKEPFTVLVE